MKKIMFNDRFGLTVAVLSGRKTQTRRIIEAPSKVKGITTRGFYVHKTPDGVAYEVVARDEDEFEIENAFIYPRYKVGEVVAVAQSYKDCGNFPDDGKYDEDGYPIMLKNSGYFNKMFVRADLMPHHIRITGARVERLQDISDEDCIKEGIICKWHAPACRNYYYVPNEIINHTDKVHETTQEAYAALIDKISGKGTWDSNPLVFVYDFELVD